MKYQVVIQFRMASREDLNRLIGFEQNLSLALGSAAIVDGHDFGSGEFNIFVLTESPIGTFERIRNASRELADQEDMRVAYRKLDNDNYTILWPPDLEDFSVA